MAQTHVKARGPYSSKDAPNRYPVPDDKVSWTVQWDDYTPVDYTHDVVKNKPVWADPDFSAEDNSDTVTYNEGSRMSHEGKYEVNNKIPRNPRGRTGMIGRGLLGKWGPNHAADPIVTRWAKTTEGERKMLNGKPVLEFVCIQRKDTGEWALPGGMVEAGDTVSATLKKEFGEEACNTLEMSPEKSAEILKQLDEFFSKGETIYKGYVDDPRNTDNAWMETVAVLFHDESNLFDNFPLQAGDDAAAVKWAEMSSSLPLYASHETFLHKVIPLLNAAFDKCL